MKRRILNICLLTSLLFSCLLLFFGCGEKVAVSGGPETIVVKFFEASLAGDADTAYNLLTEASKAEIKDKGELVKGFSESIDSYSAGSPKVSDNKARVPVTLKLKAFESNLSFDMILMLENGLWRISLSESGAELEKAMEELFKDFAPSSEFRRQKSQKALHGCRSSRGDNQG